MDSRELPDGVRLGEVFANRYRIESVLGGGAMGVVVRAYHLVLEQPVAIKFLHREASTHRDAVARFLQEARATARLRSRHVVRVLDAVDGDDYVPYIVMEYLRGTDFAQLLRDRGPIEPQEAVRCMLHAADAIAEAHHFGIIHRDVKPANLFLVDDGHGPAVVKVLDFGIAKSANLLPPASDMEGASTRPSATQSRAILGSPYYMSPEQMESAGLVDARADVWALGVTLFELITASVPYPGTTLIQVYSKIIADTSQSWRDRWPASAPAGLDDVVAKCLHRHRDDRYRNVEEFAAALGPFSAELPIGSLPPPPVTSRGAPVTSLPAHVADIVVSPRPSVEGATGTEIPLHRTLSSRPHPRIDPQRWMSLAIATLAVSVVAVGVLGEAWRRAPRASDDAALARAGTLGPVPRTVVAPELGANAVRAESDVASNPRGSVTRSDRGDGPAAEGVAVSDDGPRLEGSPRRPASTDRAGERPASSSGRGLGRGDTRTLRSAASPANAVPGRVAGLVPSVPTDPSHADHEAGAPAESDGDALRRILAPRQ